MKMALDDKVLEMQNKAQEMSKYYLKGMGSIVDGIISFAEQFLMHQEKEECIEKAYKCLKEIKDHYNKIPFDKLNEEEYYPLFIVKRLLPSLEYSLDEVFKKKDGSSFHGLVRSSQSIIDVGYLYWEDMVNLLKEIRNNPEAKDFRLKIIDYKGTEWNF